MLLKDMDEPTLRHHLNEQLTFLLHSETEDTLGTMLIIFGDNGISQYGATRRLTNIPQALRELADRLERNETVER